MSNTYQRVNYKDELLEFLKDHCRTKWEGGARGRLLQVQSFIGQHFQKQKFDFWSFFLRQNILQSNKILN